jgi:hypothetical protein
MPVLLLLLSHIAPALPTSVPVLPVGITSMLLLVVELFITRAFLLLVVLFCVIVSATTFPAAATVWVTAA